MKKHALWLALGASIPIFLIVTWMMLDNACTLSHSLGEGESTNQCYTRWIGSLSGWVAGVFAAITVVVLVSQMSTMRRQLAHQEAQTRFATGDLVPDVYPFTGNPGIVAFRLENSNLRAIFGVELSVVSPTNIHIEPVEFREVFSDFQQQQSEQIVFQCQFPGWHDRSSSPPHGDFALIFLTESADYFSDFAKLRFRFKLQGDVDYSLTRHIDVDVGHWSQRDAD